MLKQIFNLISIYNNGRTFPIFNLIYSKNLGIILFIIFVFYYSMQCLVKLKTDANSKILVKYTFLTSIITMFCICIMTCDDKMTNTLLLAFKILVGTVSH